MTRGAHAVQCTCRALHMARCRSFTWCGVDLQARVPLLHQLVAEDGRGPKVGQAVAQHVIRRLRGLGLGLGALLRRQNHAGQHQALYWQNMALGNLRACMLTVRTSLLFGEARPLCLLEGRRGAAKGHSQWC